MGNCPITQKECLGDKCSLWDFQDKCCIFAGFKVELVRLTEKLEASNAKGQRERKGK